MNGAYAHYTLYISIAAGLFQRPSDKEVFLLSEHAKRGLSFRKQRIHIQKVHQRCDFSASSLLRNKWQLLNAPLAVVAFYGLFEHAREFGANALTIMHTMLLLCGCKLPWCRWQSRYTVQFIGTPEGTSAVYGRMKLLHWYPEKIWHHEARKQFSDIFALKDHSATTSLVASLPTVTRKVRMLRKLPSQVHTVTQFCA